jgi:hypothetical protein
MNKDVFHILSPFMKFAAKVHKIFDKCKIETKFLAFFGIFEDLLIWILLKSGEFIWKSDL